MQAVYLDDESQYNPKKVFGVVPGPIADDFYDIPQRHCFNVILYTLIYFWQGTQKSNIK